MSTRFECERSFCLQDCLNNGLTHLIPNQKQSINITIFYTAKLEAWSQRLKSTNTMKNAMKQKLDNQHITGPTSTSRVFFFFFFLHLSSAFNTIQRSLLRGRMDGGRWCWPTSGCLGHRLAHRQTPGGDWTNWCGEPAPSWTLHCTSSRRWRKEWPLPWTTPPVEEPEQLFQLQTAAP